ncbi:conserved hypothetical protein [Histoplasma capsulatum var. duboisii H88]|uniref:Uncharacterized protein n=2 Tax=Ajellomyces capsulatus TaxID=5037 RepID=F0UR39_AJEC8|nr:conserved hypothetical protein [Histoplasma capsulatum H143]EGC48366.1 conserved hypothetical protein [Histoplasma capsulatum var. duboisii H88]QSS50391.1 hypothetical protein I7I53_11069 [Histoplasma capsulatum var. duboisii H88]
MDDLWSGGPLETIRWPLGFSHAAATTHRSPCRCWRTAQQQSVTDYLPTTQNCGLELRRPPPSPYRPTAKIQSSLRPSLAVVVSGGFSGSRSWSTQALALALSPLRQSVLPECDPRSSGAGPYWVASAQRCASWASGHALAGFMATDSAPLIAQPAPPR